MDYFRWLIALQIVFFSYSESIARDTGAVAQSGKIGL